MTISHLIFAAKDVGVACLDFHLKSFPEDENMIVVCPEHQAELIEVCQKYNQDYILLADFKPEMIEDRRFDWLLNLWGSYIFKDNVFSRVNDTLNIHPSLLPYGRGKDPVVWSIQENMPGGATVLRMNAAVDAGDIWAQTRIDYTLPITGGALYSKVIPACIQGFLDHWENIRAGRVSAQVQTETTCPTRKRKDLLADRLIDFDSLEPAQQQLLRRILSHDFGSGYSSHIKFGDDIYEIRLDLKKVNPA